MAIEINISRALTAIGSLLFLLLTLASNAEDRKAWQFPQELRPQLQSRLDRFLKAQADGRWEEVAQLLGNYRRANQYLKYTPEHKACFVAQMKTVPMIAFDFTVQESPFSSEIMFTPAGRRWWTLVGEASFRKGAETIKHRASLIAYRDQNDWYFTPPPFDDDAWARTHLAPGEISRDRADQVELIAPQGFPLEIVDLHVFIDPDHLATRHVQFRLRNKTDKRVIAYSFEISDAKRRGSISVGTGAARDAIEPGGLSRVWQEDDTAYLYWCEGEARMRIELQDVTFADGTSFPTTPPLARRPATEVVGNAENFRCSRSAIFGNLWRFWQSNIVLLLPWILRARNNRYATRQRDRI